MRSISRSLLLLLCTSAPGLADQFYLHYDGNDFPENEGWNRFAPYPPERSVGNGLLGLNAYGDHQTVEYYFTDPGSIHLSPGEFLRVGWRMLTTATDSGGVTPSDVMVWVANDQGAAASIYISPWFVTDGDYYVYRHVVPIAPRQFHIYELTSDDLRSYDLSIDGAPAFRGWFLDSLPFNEYMIWGDSVIGMASTSAWDYVTVEVVPESSSAALLTLATAVSVWRGRRRMLQSSASPASRCTGRRLAGLCLAGSVLAPAAYAQVYKPFTGGWVHMTLNAGTPDPSFYDVLTSGRVTLKEPGVWVIWWRDASGPPFGNGNPVDSKGVGQDLPIQHATVQYHTLWVHAASLSGSLDPGSPPYVAQDWQMRVTIAGDVTNQASIYMSKGTLYASYINGNCNGRITIGRIKEFSGDPYRALTIGGNWTYTNPTIPALDVGQFLPPGSEVFSGRVRVGGNVEGATRVDHGDLAGELWIAGDLMGPVTVANTLSGRIKINGSLVDVAAYTYDIDIAGSMGSSAAITVDWDGWQANHDWQPGAVVRVGGASYNSNTPSARIWEITECRGDMNNDAALNSFDIDPFVLALTDPAGYETAFPGLEGSREYHGDCDCDQVFNAFDIDPFVDRLVRSCCDSACPGCPSGGGAPGAASPQAVATMLRSSVVPERLPVLIGIVGNIAANHPDPERGVFWSDVLAALLAP